MAAPTVLTNAFVGVATGTATADVLTAIGGVKEVTADFSLAELPDSVMGDTLETFYPGVQSAPIDVVTREDYTSASGNNQNFYDRMVAKTAFRLTIKPVNAVASGTNPAMEYSSVRVVRANAAPSGAWGVSVENPIRFVPQSGCTLTRSTST